MYNSLFDGPEVSLPEMLAARENRAALQKELLESCPQQILLSATMNIPGAVKTSKELETIFRCVTDEIEAVVMEIIPLANVYRNEKTGYEYFLLVPLEKKELKQQMIEIEEEHKYGRLVDLDVLWLEEGEVNVLSREALDYPKRTCFVCKEDAKICGRTRAHSVEEIQKEISQLVERGRMQAND
ncbi:holo-ACP synthase CitX [Enterococcus sp. AZ194]|uniref:citrate lyase holo-[acyl-carrier protein] synthase n=1 Tax=Enterococcus sp. AZ194 TaxID=2774629 RepID=UPI003F28FCE0